MPGLHNDMKVPEVFGLEMRVGTIEQYLHAVEKANEILWQTHAQKDIKYSQKLWFRGIRAFDYPLLPSIGRKDLNVDYEKLFLSKFISKVIPLLTQSSLYPIIAEIGTYWEWLFLMQEYGYPTRLMEWTEDALVALVFAIDSEASEVEKESDAAVWCLNPVMLNTAFDFHDYYPQGYIPNVQEAEVYKRFGLHAHGSQNKKPAAVYGPLSSPRTIVQQGTVTIFPYTVPLVDIKELPDCKHYLARILVAKEFRNAMAEQLRRYGITKAQLMPDIGTLI